MSSPQASVLPRQTGGFRLERELGRGGMGVVYEACEIESGRTVALKVLAAELAVSGEAFERFRREARLAAAISDARCVFVYGAHQVDGSPAIAMELVGGETLQDKIARGETIPIETAVRWAIDVIDGLEAAHQTGIIHRDVKPSNCFVTPDGRVKIGDFGLSRTLERDIELTQSGQFLGSPLYASPEQIRGRTVDARSDQYSCAATLYALLTGRAPFGGANVGEVLARILSEAPPRTRSIRPEVPSELERVVRRGMERDPDKRYRDLESFRDALLPFSSQEAAAASIAPRLAAWILDATLATYVLNGALGAYLQSRTGQWQHDPAREWVSLPLWTQFVLGLVPVLYFGLSEAFFGRTIGKYAFGLRVASVGPGPALWVRALVRAFLFELPYLLMLFPWHYLPRDADEYALATLVLFVVPFAVRVSTMRKRNGWRGPHELWTGTRVIQAQLPFRRIRRTAPPPEAAVEQDASWPARIGEYDVSGVVGHTASGPLLRARDARLERSVWIQLRSHGPATSEARRAVARSSRLRWLEALRTPAGHADVFEAPGGTSLAGLAARDEQVEWPLAERAIAALAEEVARSESEAQRPLRWSAGQVWFDRRWNVRLLDEPTPPTAPDLDARALIGSVARSLLHLGPGREFPRDLPVHAEPLVRALNGQDPLRRGHAPTSLDQLRSQIAACQASAPTVERRTRGAQLAINTLLLALLTIGTLVLTAFLFEFIPHMVETRAVLRELSANRVAAQSEELGERGAPTPSGPELSAESRRDRQIVLAYESLTTMGRSMVAQLEDEEHLSLVRAAREAVPNLDEATFAAASARIRAERGPGVRPEVVGLGGTTAPRAGMIVIAVAAAMWALTALVSSLVWPGGLSFRFFDLALRRSNGRRAGRIFGLVRTLLIGVPLAAGYCAAAMLANRPDTTSVGWLAWVVLGVVVALHVAGLTLTLLAPARGPVDRLLGSRVVPR